MREKKRREEGNRGKQASKARERTKEREEGRRERKVTMIIIQRNYPEIGKISTNANMVGPSPGYIPSQGIKLRSPALQADFSPAKPPGKPKNTEVGSLSLL